MGTSLGRGRGQQERHQVPPQALGQDQPWAPTVIPFSSQGTRPQVREEGEAGTPSEKLRLCALCFHKRRGWMLCPFHRWGNRVSKSCILAKLPSARFVPRTILGTGTTAGNKTDRPSPLGTRTHKRNLASCCFSRQPGGGRIRLGAG